MSITLSTPQRIIYPLLLLGSMFILSLISWGCDSSRDIDTRHAIDLYSLFTNQISAETQEVTFQNYRANPAHLISGIVLRDRRSVFCEWQGARFWFCATAQELNPLLKVTAKAQWSGPVKGTLDVTVKVNDTEVGVLQFHLGVTVTAEIRIPNEMLQPGVNFVQFTFPAVTKISRFIPRYPLVLEKIVFSMSEHTTSHHEPHRGFRKFAYVELPCTFTINCKLKSQRQGKIKIMIHHENGEEIRSFWDLETTTYARSFRFSSAGICFISFELQSGKLNFPEISYIELTYSEIPNKYGSKALPITNARKAIYDANQMEKAKPNIILFVVDALRADRLGCYGNPIHTSPYIDKFSKRAVLYPHSFSNASWTRASAATILSGLTPKEHATMSRQDKFPENVVTLAEYLKHEGYYTAAFMGNGNLSEAFGFKQGFDYFDGYFEAYEKTQHVTWEQLNQAMERFLINFRNNDNQKPLFILMWIVDPHDPYTPPEKLRSLYAINHNIPGPTDDMQMVVKLNSRKLRLIPSQIGFVKKRYDQEVYYTDIAMKEFQRSLTRTGVWQQSVVFFMADHGEEFADHGGYGHGFTLYHEMIHVPLIAKYPHLRGAIDTSTVQHIDVYPTIVSLLGSELPYRLDGVSLLGESKPKRVITFEERLFSNMLFAVYSPAKDLGLIANKGVNRPASQRLHPSLELFRGYGSLIDWEKVGSNPDFTLQYLFQEAEKYQNLKHHQEIKQANAVIDRKTEERLREIGYVE